MSCFLQCTRKHRYQYVDKIKTMSTGALVLGNHFHKGLELNYAQKIRTEKDLPVEKITDYFRKTFGRAINADNVQLDPTETVEGLTELGCRMLETHHKFIAHTVQPLFVEKNFRCSLGEGFPFDLTGRWDLIDIGYVIVDNKTYGRPPKQEWLDRDLQMSVYSLAFRLTFGEIEAGLRIDAVTKAKTPRVLRLYTHRTDNDAKWLLGQIECVAAAILKGVDYPQNDSPLCSPQYCGYWNLCKVERRY
ncbi:MAG: PD-(D/E)XK nuclease family protein [candidate division Zixibacteria bacterium]|nr:PD-(D/E)XK nuclease family protein [candidate division Zixibacteria bacterium]